MNFNPMLLAMSDYAIYALAVFGALVVVRFVLWPVIEAVIFGYMHLLLLLLNATPNRKMLKPRCVYFLITHPWIKAFERLFGLMASCQEITQGKWRYTPPFKIWKLK